MSNDVIYATLNNHSQGEKLVYTCKSRIIWIPIPQSICSPQCGRRAYLNNYGTSMSWCKVCKCVFLLTWSKFWMVSTVYLSLRCSTLLLIQLINVSLNCELKKKSDRMAMVIHQFICLFVFSYCSLALNGVLVCMFGNHRVIHFLCSLKLGSLRRFPSTFTHVLVALQSTSAK